MHRPASLPKSCRWPLPARCANSSLRPEPQRAAVVWFRRDLRTVDHEGLAAVSHQQYSHVLPVYCLDPVELQPHPLSTQPGLGVPQLGPHRLRFLCQALTHLQQQLQQQYGSGLACLWGRPPQQLPAVVTQLAQEVQQVDLYFQQDHVALPAAVQAEEEAAAAAVAAGQAAGCTVRVRRTWGGTLYHPADLPWVQEAVPAVVHQTQQQVQAEQGPSPKGSHVGGSTTTAAAAIMQGSSLSSSLALQQQVAGGEADVLLSQLPVLLQGLPGTMTEFRKAIHGQPANKQGRKHRKHTSTGSPTPSSAAGTGSAGYAAGECARSSQGSAPAAVVVPRVPIPAPQQLSPLPACFTEQCSEPPLVQLHRQAAATAGLSGQSPADGAAAPEADLAWLYQAAGPEAAQALLRLHQLTGQVAPTAQQAAAVGPLEATCQDGVGGQLEGGEAAAWQRLRWLLQVPGYTALQEGEQGSKPPFLAGYKESRMLAYGQDASALLSPYMALGMLTPACIHQAVQQLLVELKDGPQTADGVCVEAGCAEQQQQQQQQQQACVEGAEQLLMHLDIRDFFIWSAIKAGSSLVSAGGPSQRSGLEWRADAADLQRWCRGGTGFPFVDASMRQLAATGWMSNRGRQNVASFLAKALQVDWRLGAELFQSLLLDHDAAVNLSSWAYVAGVGADPRDRVFKTVTQGERYDPQGQLAAAWLPELSHLPPELRHRPWLQDGVDASSSIYPPPMLDPASQVAEGPRKPGGA